MENYRGLEGHKFFISGWVQTMYCIQTPVAVILKAQVRPSMRVNAEFHNPWIAVQGWNTVTAWQGRHNNWQQKRPYVERQYPLYICTRLIKTTFVTDILFFFFLSTFTDKVSPAHTSEHSCSNLKQL